MENISIPNWLACTIIGLIWLLYNLIFNNPKPSEALRGIIILLLTGMIALIGMIIVLV